MLLNIQVDPTSRGELAEAIRQLTVLHDSLPVAAIPHPEEEVRPLELPDPAAIFAPSTAAVAASPIAPVAASATSPMPSAPVPPAPNPAPAAAVPSAVAPPANPAGVELDVKGLPWDGRIHSSTKAKNADGSWRARRGLNDGGLVARVEAELRGAMAAPGPAAPPVPVAPTATAAPVVPAAPSPSFPGSTATGEVPAVPVVPPVVVATEVKTFPEFMKRVIPLMQSNPPQVSRDEVNAILAARGIGGLPLLAPRPDIIPDVWADIEALRASKPPAVPAAPALPPGTTLQ